MAEAAGARIRNSSYKPIRVGPAYWGWACSVNTFLFVDGHLIFGTTTPDFSSLRV